MPASSKFTPTMEYRQVTNNKWVTTPCAPSQPSRNTVGSPQSVYRLVSRGSLGRPAAYSAHSSAATLAATPQAPLTAPTASAPSRGCVVRSCATRTSGSREASIHEEGASSPSRPCRNLTAEVRTINVNRLPSQPVKPLEPVATEANQTHCAVAASANALGKDTPSKSALVRSSSPGSRSQSPTGEARYLWKLKWVLEKA